MSDAPVIAIILDPEQARQLARNLLEAIETPECKSIAVYCTQHKITALIESMDDMPDPDIIMTGYVTMIGMPAEVEVVTGHLDLKYRNPTKQ